MMMQQNQMAANQNQNAPHVGESELVLGAEQKANPTGFENNTSSLKELKVRGEQPGAKQVDVNKVKAR